jgi:Ca-activated chloride channel family protein
MTENATGLIAQTATGQAVTVALQGVAVQARLDGICATVTVAQQYTNAESVPIEAVYVFPLDDQAAVCGFRARIGDRLIIAQVRPREEAFAEYDEAMRRGAGAMLLEQERPNIFTASIGNLNPGQTIAIELEYVAPLSREGQALRFALPTTISPRYHPASTDAVQLADQQRVSPPVALHVPYGLTLAIDVALGTPIRRIESPGHALSITLDGATARITLSSAQVALDRDVVILIEPAAQQQPMALVSRDTSGTPVVQVTFLPDGLDAAARSAREVIFIVDCSGSMAGSSITEARRAMDLCIRQMREGDTLNIVRFGSSYTSLWPAPRSYTAASFAEALAYAAATDAELGGTEVLAPLQHVFAATPGAPVRDILLLTDGQVSNESAVIALCRANQARNRVFSFGIGAGSSASLVRGVADATRGAAEFITPGERIEPKVLRMFNRIGSVLFDRVRIDWGGLDVEQAPHAVPPLFAGDALVVRGRVRGGSASRLTLHADERQWSVPLDLAAAASAGPIPLMWAREMIRDLDEERVPEPRRGSNQRAKPADTRRDGIRALAMRYGLLSAETSFVAIEERTGSERTTQQAELRRIPIALTSGWGDQDAGVRYHSGVGAVMAASAPVLASAPMAPPTGALPRLLRAFRMYSPPDDDRASEVMHALPTPAMPRAALSHPGAQAAKPSADDVLQLLATQAFDGSFMLSQLLLARTKHASTTRAAARRYGEAVVATALVLALLQRSYAARHAEWQGAADKARAWLAQQPNGSDFDAAALLR